MKKTFLSAKESAEFLGVKLSYLYKLTHRKQIAYYKPNGKLVYFQQSDLEQWLIRCRISTQEELDEIATSRTNKGLKL